ncbi:uncharacterized protein TNCV_2197301 [Trichonephila clavipes]|nr:uncharacterized protein TNCV_2197301 [Trichonephila clavipes]
MHKLQDALFIGYKQSLNNARSIVFSQRTSSTHLIEDETFSDSDIINNFIDYEDGLEKRTGFFDSGYNICWDPAFQQIGKAFS